MKRVQIKFGTPSSDTLKQNQYDHSHSYYCYGVVMQKFTKKTPSDCNVIACDATIFEIFDVGKSQGLNPYPGIFFASLENHRLYLSHSNLEDELADPRPFLQSMLAKVETWPSMLCKNGLGSASSSSRLECDKYNR